MRLVPNDLAVFLQGLDDKLLLPALWLVRRSGLGAILDTYEPDERAVARIEDLLVATNRQLYDFFQERMEEN